MKDSAIHKVAALPYRLTPEGVMSVLLVTSRRSRRWIVPKGHLETGYTPWDMAAREAYEEAGVMGTISSRLLGCFTYRKVLESGAISTSSVQLFALAVGRELEDWPERDSRRRQWFKVVDAIAAVEQEDLREIMLAFAGRVADGRFAY
ncbi:NUDIX hydrolase [Sphingomonas sp. LaA6.9]|uniref:NUDIX hydrolase n=1 Tax=Sphingomonas sp. LaA6.9 TaxID=2919914 RepID=UPI001F4F1AEA|nr:NUDIX hydrolase [Sphingomonas sp. LaA6.9]MCJ8156316.1 NUDIX hydrolase [Sphingomonas sp. LaA6.9]